MKKLLLTIVVLVGMTLNAHAAGVKRQVRCGWIFNPTPGNIVLIDTEQYLIGVQGGHQAEGDLDNEVPKDQFVEVNGLSYGYYCGCIDADIDRRNQVIKIYKSKAKLLKVCLKDPNIISLK